METSCQTRTVMRIHDLSILNSVLMGSVTPTTIVVHLDYLHHKWKNLLSTSGYVKDQEGERTRFVLKLNLMILETDLQEVEHQEDQEVVIAHVDQTSTVVPEEHAILIHKRALD